MPKLKLQYFGHFMWRVDSLEKRRWGWSQWASRMKVNAVSFLLQPAIQIIGAGGEGDNRGWDGWMASLTRWAWVWVNSGSWWWTGRPGVLRLTGSQRVGHDWATELNWTETRTKKMGKRQRNLWPCSQEDLRKKRKDQWLRSIKINSCMGFSQATQCHRKGNTDRSPQMIWK